MHYRKKRSTASNSFAPKIQAIRCNAVIDKLLNRHKYHIHLPEWIGKLIAEGRVVLTGDDTAVLVFTVENEYLGTAELGSWIISDEHGNIHVCSDKILELYYEPYEPLQE